MSSPLLSLVTGKVGRDREFVRLVDSIVAHTTVEWELVVSDASDEPYRPILGNIKVIHEKPKRTCVYGYNTAFWQASGMWCIYLNDDAEVTKDYDTAAISFMQSHPEIGLGALHYSENGGPFHVNAAYGCTYANFGIISRQLGNHVGWFDEDLVMYGNDNSLTFRVLLARKGVADIPTARVIHHSQIDKHRTANQEFRIVDNRTLTRKYMPHKHAWMAVYKKYEVKNETVAWAHGVKP